MTLSDTHARLMSHTLPLLLIAVGVSGFAANLAHAQSVTQANAPQDQTFAQPAQPGFAADPQDAQDDQAADQDQGSDPAVTDPDADPAAVENAALRQDLGRQNMAEQTVDGLRPAKTDQDLTPGIPMGAFTFRPTISGGVGVERTKTGGASDNRSYFTTGVTGSLTSNWSRHELRVDTTGNWQKTISGVSKDDPEGSISAALRLDLADDTIAALKAGYSLEREDLGSANAVDGASTQGEVSTWTASGDITRDLGVFRTTLGADFERNTYGEATLDSGAALNQSDRDENTATLRGRIGYELSPAIIPFVEASYGRMIYDNHKDSSGYIRDAAIYAAKSGVQVDFGEKLRGELAGGYTVADFEDSRLDSLSGFTLNGSANWSPRRGTDVELGLKTEVEPSTAAGTSGSIAYTANAALSQEVLRQLTARVTAATTLRDYAAAGSANQMVYDLGAGLTWGLSRSLDLNADIAWERSTQSGSSDQDSLTAGVNIAFKR